MARIHDDELLDRLPEAAEDKDVLLPKVPLTQLLSAVGGGRVLTKLTLSNRVEQVKDLRRIGS